MTLFCCCCFFATWFLHSFSISFLFLWLILYAFPFFFPVHLCVASSFFSLLFVFTHVLFFASPFSTPFSNFLVIWFCMYANTSFYFYIPLVLYIQVCIYLKPNNPTIQQPKPKPSACTKFLTKIRGGPCKYLNTFFAFKNQFFVDFYFNVV